MQFLDEFGFPRSVNLGIIASDAGRMKVAQNEEADGGVILMMLVMITINDFNRRNFADDVGDEND